MSPPLRALISLALLGILCSAQPSDKRMSIPSINRLKLYAYGANIGGLPIFSADGIAQIGDPNLSSASMKTPMCMSTQQSGHDINNPYQGEVRIASGNRIEPSMWMADVDHEKVSPSKVIGFIIDGILAATSVLALSNSDAFFHTTSIIKDDTYSKPVVFTAMAGSRAGMLTDVWYLYGSFVLLNVPGAAFYAQPTGKEGLYNLMWSTSKMASLNSIPITIKTTGPATGSAQMISGA